MKHKLRLLVMFTLLVLVLLPVGTVWATCPPTVPQLIQGSVTIDGSLAPDGTSITVWVGATQIDSTTTSGGNYGVSICTDDYGGDTLVFKVNGVQGGQMVCPASPGGPITLDLVVTGEPNITVSPTSKNFGNVQVGSSSSPQTFTVGNNGNANLNVGTISITGSGAAHFAIQNDNASGQTIAPAGSRTLQVLFSPTSAGTKTAQLSIPSNDPDENPKLVNLQGRGTEAPAPPTPVGVTTQVAFLLDTSGSIGSSDWSIMVNGLADAVEDSDCCPHNGSVELTVVRFGGGADVPVGPVVITSANAASVASQIRAIAYLGGGTNMAAAFDAATNALKNSPNFSPSLKQAINLVSDGYPNSYSLTEIARNNCISELSMTAKQDVICSELIGFYVDLSWVRDSIVFPQPGCDWPLADPSPDCAGWVRQVTDMPSFVDTLCEKLKAIIAAPPECDFSATPTSGMAPLRVQFKDLSTGDIDSWEWDFDNDGEVDSTQRNPMHVYMESGRYTVTLTVTGPGGTCEKTKTAYITVREFLEEVERPPNLAAAYLLISPEQGRPGQEFEISINIGNDGGTTGTRSVALYINGEMEQSQTVSVSAGSSKLLIFRVTKYDAGTYQVLVEGNEGQFTVLNQGNAKYWPGPLGTPGIIVIVVVAIALIVAIVFVFARRE